MFFFLSAGLVVFLDQLSKFWVRKWLSPSGAWEVIPGFFRLVKVWNPGVAFGLFAEHPVWARYFIMALGLLAVGVFYHLARKGLSPWACGLVAGGALGNLLDRLFYGRVFDFLDLYYGKYHWPAFNLADSAISIGIFLLLLETLSSKPSK